MEENPQATELAIWADADGGNPRNRDGIRRDDVDAFTIYPECEAIITAGSTGAMARPAGGPRCDVKIWNGHDGARSVAIRIDRRAAGVVHQQSDYDYVYIRGDQDSDWQLCHAVAVTGSTSVFEVQAQPGLTLLSQNPAYTFGDFQRFVASLATARDVETRLAGFSEQGREIWWLKIADAASRDAFKYRILITGRQHPYETASSYAIEAMVRWLLSDSKEASQARRKCDFHLVPMPNPDGVYLGTTVLTNWDGDGDGGGVNLTDGKTNPERDSAFRALMSVAQQVQPHQYVEMHNWMNKDYDLLAVLSDPVALGDRQQTIFRQSMPDQTQYGRRWETHVHTDPKDTWSTSPVIDLLRSRLFRTYDSHLTKCIHVPEFPWFGRDSAAAMVQTGIDMLRADVQVILGLNDDSLEEPRSVAKAHDPESAPVTPPERPLVYVIQEQSLSFDRQIQPWLEQFVADLEADGYAVTVLDRVTSGVDPTMIRDTLREGYRRGLVGAILVGNIPSASTISRTPSIQDDGRHLPTDLYSMALDADADEAFKEGGGRTDADVWIGRIRADTVGREAELLANYFRKNHEYRSGRLALPPRALTYLDVKLDGNVHEHLGLLYPKSCKVVSSPATSAGDYLKELAAGYEWVYINCDGDARMHRFTDRQVRGPDLRRLAPRAHFYHVSAPGSSNHNAWGYVAGSYLFARSHGLCVLVSPGLPADQHCRAFYESIAQGIPIGGAFKAWLNGSVNPNTRNQVTAPDQQPKEDRIYPPWRREMAIAGDPTLTWQPRRQEA